MNIFRFMLTRQREEGGKKTAKTFHMTNFPSRHFNSRSRLRSKKLHPNVTISILVLLSINDQDLSTCLINEMNDTLAHSGEDSERIST